MESVFDFLHEVEKLKSTLRYTSLRCGRKESTAEHSWRLALMSFLVAKQLGLDIDTERAMKIALVHDIAEAVTGDIDAIRIAEGEVSREEKNHLELDAMEKLKATLPKELGEDFYSLWEEYDNASSKEAKFIKALDKIETLTQLTESGYKTYDKPEFIANYADNAVRAFPELKGMLKIVKRKLRDEFEKGNLPWKEEYDAFE